MKTNLLWKSLCKSDPIFFQHLHFDRQLPGLLSSCSYDAVRERMVSVADDLRVVPGMIVSLQTYEDQTANWHLPLSQHSITDPIPDPGQQLIHYLGWYSVGGYERSPPKRPLPRSVLRFLRSCIHNNAGWLSRGNGLRLWLYGCLVQYEFDVYLSGLSGKFDLSVDFPHFRSKKRSSGRSSRFYRMAIFH